ncbi:hypothetical protein ACP4OV_014660 [Aristida adscensionis]
MAARWAPVVGLLLLLPLVPSATSSSIAFKVDGNVYPAGHFYVTMNIGNPAKPYFLDIDTGSTLTWVECDAGSGSCKTCRKVPHPLYRAQKLVPCADSMCDALHQDLDSPKNCPDAKQCDYEIRYLDGLSSLGVLVIDHFVFPMEKAPTIAFGCGYDQQGGSSGGKAEQVDGILGLGKGSVDLVSQLKRNKIITKHVIGHCFSSKGGGYLVVGDVNVPSLAMTWVPMAPRTPGKPYYYSPGQATLLMDTKSIGAKPMKVVLDSGSTYTYLPVNIRAELISKLKASISKSLVVEPDPELPLCWKGPGRFKSPEDLKKEFKSTMSLKFGNGATMIIPPENYLIVTERGNACLGILDMKGLDMYIIGDITLQDQLVIYDNEKRQLGWMRSPCDKLPKSTSPIFSRI